VTETEGGEGRIRIEFFVFVLFENPFFYEVEEPPNVIFFLSVFLGLSWITRKDTRYTEIAPALLSFIPAVNPSGPSRFILFNFTLFSP